MTVKILWGTRVFGLMSLLKITSPTVLFVWVGFCYLPTTTTAKPKGLICIEPNNKCFYMFFFSPALFCLIFFDGITCDIPPLRGGHPSLGLSIQATRARGGCISTQTLVDVERPVWEPPWWTPGWCCHASTEWVGRDLERSSSSKPPPMGRDTYQETRSLKASSNLVLSSFRRAC